MSTTPIATTVSSVVSDVDSILTSQRDESDARDLINEVEKINLFEGIHRFRWIWELFQNARDEAGNGIEIIVELSQHRFSFSHNGQPFDSGNLLALTRKTSTKPIDGSPGKAGKFGTGFVTTHLLNKRVVISGVHINNHGRRRFEHVVDRSAETLDGMMKSIAASIENVRRIDKIPAQDGDIDPWNCFAYDLSAATTPIAQGGIYQLRTNLDFAMLLNPNVRSVKIIEHDNVVEFKSVIEPNALNNVSFFHFDKGKDVGDTDGALFTTKAGLTIGIPARLKEGKFKMLPFGECARLFKELPLIGTENLPLPVIVHHENFQPTELRDGVRTRLSADSTEESDTKARKNRIALREFVAEFSSFLKALSQRGVSNLHQLAESGLPDNDAYYDTTWYEKDIQRSIRAAILEQKLVRSVSGSMLLIKDSLFLSATTQELELLYDLVNRLYPDRFPDAESFNDWVRIINQDTTAWPPGIIFDVAKLVLIASRKDDLQLAFTTDPARVAWLQSLVSYLEACGQERLGIEHAIYPTQSGELAIQTKIHHDRGLDPQFKKVSAGIGRTLEKELLVPGFEATFVTDFDVETFFGSLNTTIGALAIEKATANQVQAVIDLCCSFKSDRAEKREQWYEVIHELLPARAKAKISVEFKEQYNWESSEKWCLNYVCTLVQACDTTNIFIQTYFTDDALTAFKWLSSLLNFIFRNKENSQAARDYKLIPTQDGKFKVYSDQINVESQPGEFAERIKPLYRDYVGTVDPASFLVDLRLNNENLRTAGIEIISRPVDDLFNSREAEDLVKEGQRYHELFLALKELMEKPEAADYFPSFSKKQPILYIKAFGEGSSLGKLLKLNKSVEEFEQLDKLSLSASEMKQLDDAVAEIGSAQRLIDRANDMVKEAEQVRWRQNVGYVAERAFLEALAQSSPEFPKPENPDDGKDFVIRIADKYFSIEIKSAIENKETVKMSIKQGQTAAQKEERDRYALGVISRPDGQLTSKEHFISKSKFVVDIGEQIGDKIAKWQEGVLVLDTDDDVSVQLDNKTGFVNIKKATWTNGISFDDFIVHLKKHFGILQ